MDQQIGASKMDSNLLANLIAARKNVVQELTEAHGLANQLRAIINEPFGTDRSVEAVHLISKILRSFTESISILNSCEFPDTIPANTRELISANTRELISAASTLAVKKGPIYRRKASSSRTKITSRSLEDGHAWRKYGQKDIPGDKYPRSYYRCNNHNSRGCQARKQAQRIEDDPPMHEIIYTGNHTCKKHQIILDSSTPTDSINSAHFSLGSSNSPNDELNDPSYPTSTTTHHPPVIIYSYRT